MSFFKRIFSSEKKQTLDEGLARSKRGVLEKLTRAVTGKKDIDADVELKSTPAAALSEQEVLKLRWLAAQGRFIRCGECGRQMLVDVTRASGRCHGCGVQWSAREGRH